jgi:hypothetical protein
MPFATLFDKVLMMDFYARDTHCDAGNFIIKSFSPELAKTLTIYAH